MSTTHGQPGLSSDQRSTIRSTILSTRHTLEDELRRQLEKYGIYEDKKLQRDQLTHLSVEELHTRDRIDAAIKRELESTEGDLERSITNYVREATKTYLNRFVALKTIEVRGLVEETITERPEYGNRSYMHHTVAEIAGELTNASDDGFGAALDLAYQEIGAEIRMIFEESEHTAIDLDAQVREEVLDELNQIDDVAWESDEALGWVYQYFGEEEREEIDERVDEENYKIAGTDIATKTQLFTPRYIVEWMVDNTLGRTWLEMQGNLTDIHTEENCFYLSPVDDSLHDREEKPVEEITVLDPACGSGHMLFYAFDVLYQMYLEEGKYPKEHIPREILRNNLYGIDIDSGAAQIAALSLYLKAKEKSPEVTIPRVNIVSGDAVLINGDRKQEVLESARSELEEEIIEQIWDSFADIREFGSLIRVEERIDEILEEHRDAIRKSGQAKFTSEGTLATQSSFVSGEGQEETWEEVKQRLLDQVSNLASQALEQNSAIGEMFAEEVGKTVEILDVLVHEYDVVLSNPPYLVSQKMGDNLKNFLKSNFISYRNSYTCFIERGTELTADDGYASLVTPEDLLMLKSYRKIREKLIDETQITEGLHLSRYGFDQQKDSYTIAFVIRNNDKNFEKSRFYRLTHELERYSTFEKKIEGLNQIQGVLRTEGDHQDVYVVNQNSFTGIGNNTFVYWFGQDILSLFDKHNTLDQYVETFSGIVTGDNDHHLRKFWEVTESNAKSDYEPWVDNGRDTDYYDYTDTLVRWENNGENIKQYAKKHGKNIQGFSELPEMFNPAIVFRDFSSDFTAKYLTEEAIHSKTAYKIDIADDLMYYLLGYLNSDLNRYIMKGLNPGLHFNPGDVENIPFDPSPDELESVEHWAKYCLEQRKQQAAIEDKSLEFDNTVFRNNYDELCYYTEMTDAKVALASGVISELVYANYGIDGASRKQISEEGSAELIEYPYVCKDNDAELPDVFADKVRRVVDPEYWNEIRRDVSSSSELDVIELSHEFEVSPLTVAEIKKEIGQYSDDQTEKAAGSIVSVIFGSLFGYYDAPTPENDGILDISDHADEYERLFVTTAEELFQDYSQVEKEIQTLIARDLRTWVRERYFRYNHCKEYNRRGQTNPIYWQIESPDGAFSCFVYYHDIDANTLPKLRGQYLDPRIDELENELETLNTQTKGDSPDTELLNRKEEVQNDLNDIKEFRDTIDQMIDDGVGVDVEKGIWENIKEWDQYEVLETGLPKIKSSYSR